MKKNILIVFLIFGIIYSYWNITKGKYDYGILMIEKEFQHIKSHGLRHDRGIWVNKTNDKTFDGVCNYKSLQMKKFIYNKKYNFARGIYRGNVNKDVLCELVLTMSTNEEKYYRSSIATFYKKEEIPLGEAFTYSSKLKEAKK